jgi:FACT complex subunit SSRP1/POB3
VPLAKVSNTNLVGKNEVAVEFALPKDGEKAEREGGDELVEMRFYVPGMKEKDKEEERDSDAENVHDEDVGETTTAATVCLNVSSCNMQDFYETLKEKASIGEVAGESIVTFTNQLLTTPRGRYDVDMYDKFLRLRGKTYDYKINYEQVVKLFLLPKPDDTHVLFVIGVDPPLRQGQTRYPFLVIQFMREEDMEVELNIEEYPLLRTCADNSDVYQAEYATRLKQKYDAPAYDVVSSIFRGLTGRKIVAPGTFTNHLNQRGVKCALKASEGILYPLEKYLLFVPKPTILIDLDDVDHVTFSR